MKNLHNKVAAITGAGSGIGQATALLLAKKGCHLAITDINEVGLADTVRQCEALGVKVSSQKLDVAQKDAVHAWAEQVVADHGRVNIIINNAGVGLGATVEDMRYSDMEWLMNINFWGVVYGTKAFLPHIKAAGEGHIVNISSLFGLVSVPSQSAYNAAKFAVRGFTESLREEMEIEGNNVGVTCVHPGGIKTNIAKSSRVTETPGMIDRKATEEFEKVLRTSPARAAETIVNAIEKNSRRLLIGNDAKAIDLAQRLMPTTYQKIVEVGAKIRRKKMLERA